MGHAQSSKSTSPAGGVKRISLAEGLEPASVDVLNTNEIFKQGKAFLLFEEYTKDIEKNNLQLAEEFSFSDLNLEMPRQIVEDRVATLGSREEIFVYRRGDDCGGDTGFFASILTAYNYHWALRTSPDDWWFCIIRHVAKAIDKNSKKESVRQFFVNHEGKRTLEVKVDSPSVYEVDYGWFFDEMSQQISQHVKVTGYTDAVTADFSTTTRVQTIVSQITLMSSVQEFFDFTLTCYCGIPVVEMLGTDEDWKRLLTKLHVLKSMLKPIKNDIGLNDRWWAVGKEVFSKLLATFRGKPDKKWWSNIMTYEESFGSAMGSAEGWNGWIVDFLKEPGGRLPNSAFSANAGPATVPLIFEDAQGVTDKAVLVAGILGFTLHQETSADVPSVRPFQGWSLLLQEYSYFRKTPVERASDDGA